MMTLRSIGSCRSATLDSVIAATNTDVEGERRRNTDVPIDDPVISDVDKRVSVVRHEAGSTGSASD